MESNKIFTQRNLKLRDGWYGELVLQGIEQDLLNYKAFMRQIKTVRNKISNVYKYFDYF